MIKGLMGASCGH